MGRRPKPDVDGIDGVLVIDKAQEMTSHDVVAIARGALKMRKIGHSGTLDPMATGVLVLLLGKATKLQDHLMAQDKIYEGRLRLGELTDSQDADGDVVETREVPDLSKEQIISAFDTFKGAFEQIPPMVSAIKQDGVRLYKLARKGKVVERKPRAVEVKDYALGAIELPEVDFVVSCSKGFYVRTYAYDIGEHLGCGAHLNRLRRVKNGYFDLSCAVTIDELRSKGREWLEQKVIPLEEVAALAAK